eukprot:SAG25_NODE_8008_length_446_cov_0.729107_1_plen_68_part_10
MRSYDHTVPVGLSLLKHARQLLFVALQAEKEAAEAAANAALLIEKKRLQLAQVQAQGGKARAGAGPRS